MSATPVRLTYVGGPTALIEIDGLRVLTDPTFDPAFSEYQTPAYVLRKTQDPAITAQALGPIDLVLLSHDHHFDNLDRAGRRVLESASAVVTTAVGAGRIGGYATGLEPWRTQHVQTPGAGDHRDAGTTRPAGRRPRPGDRLHAVCARFRCADRLRVRRLGLVQWYR
jgi:L-ascorbate metabolism protein UlaG (beta-lactamase superfamily)